MKTRMMIAALLVWILITPAHAYMAQKEFRMNASGLDSLTITCGAGELHVKQNPGEDIHVLAEIEIRGLKEKEADVFARESIALWLRKTKKRAHLKSAIHQKPWRALKASVHLTVSVPAGLNLFIDDGSGGIVITSFQGDARIKDGSGNIEIRQLRGQLEIDDGSGEIKVQQVKGHITLTDGSGTILVEDLQGGAGIEDGSGDISVSRITGDLRIRDGSGAIRVNEAQGNVIVSDGSGSIDILNVGKDVVVERDSSGSRRISNVGGSVFLKE